MKSKLGQNFLTSKEIVNKAIETANPDVADIILDIGAGKGIFISQLLKRGLKTVAVEKDRELINFLKDKFEDETKEGKLEIIEEDILNFEMTGNYKIIANIPFYITGAILKKFLQSENQPSSMTLIVQKEVGERILAKDGKESILSISAKVYGEPSIVKNVSKKYFKPQPKVDSVILHIGNISKNFFTKNKIDEKKFFELVKTGFSSKRKYLSNNLKIYKSKGHPWTWTTWTNHLNPKVRAEDLKLEDWKELYLTIR